MSYDKQNSEDFSDRYIFGVSQGLGQDRIELRGYVPPDPEQRKNVQ